MTLITPLKRFMMQALVAEFSEICFLLWHQIAKKYLDQSLI
jgi:hypothetical protein